MPFIKGQIAWNKGKEMPFISRKMKAGFMPVKAFKKGNTPWNKGIKRPEMENEGNPSWKGENAGYDALHDWVKRRLGFPNKCKFCGTTEKRVYQWANISGEYKRDIKDWMRLCIPCHKRYDLTRKNKTVFIVGKSKRMVRLSSLSTDAKKP